MFPADVTIAPARCPGDALERRAHADALALAASLRAAGLRVDVYPEADKLGKQLKYAATRGFRIRRHHRRRRARARRSDCEEHEDGRADSLWHDAAGPLEGARHFASGFRGNSSTGALSDAVNSLWLTTRLIDQDPHVRRPACGRCRSGSRRCLAGCIACAISAACCSSTCATADGLTQVVVAERRPLMADAKRLRAEYVVGVTGEVRRRVAETVNPKLADRRSRGRRA